MSDRPGVRLELAERLAQAPCFDWRDKQEGTPACHEKLQAAAHRRVAAALAERP